MQTGQHVTVIDAWGNKLKRIVVKVSGDKIWVCKADEFDNASHKGRRPTSIGFPAADVKVNGK